MEKENLLKYILNIVSLTQEEQDLLMSKIAVRKYAKGEYVLQNGEICKIESFVLSGCLKTYFIDPNGEEHIIMFAVENWWSADLGSFIKQVPADYNIQCLEPSILAQISHSDLEELFEQIPALDRLFRLIIQNAYVAAQKRLINSYSMPAKDRYLIFSKQYPAIEQRVPQYMIASYLGITKEFLSKIRHQLTQGE